MVRRAGALRQAKSTTHIESKRPFSTDARSSAPQTAQDHVLDEPNSLKRRHDLYADQVPTKATGNAGALVNAKGDAAPSPKRQRGEEWPLKNDVCPLSKRDRGSPRPHSKSVKNSPRPYKLSARPSRFQEGSLNDKPISQPPDVFIGEEQLMERYSTNQDVGTDMADLDPTRETLEDSRPANASRFGRLSKAFAGVFNPSIVWHGIHGRWKEKEPNNSSLIPVAIDNRKAEAEKAYAELKRTRFKGTAPPVVMQHDHTLLDERQGSFRERQRNTFRDSAIDVDDDDLLAPPLKSFADRLSTTRRSLDTETKGHTAVLPTRSSRRVSSFDPSAFTFQKLKKGSPHYQFPNTKPPNAPMEEQPATANNHDLILEGCTPVLQKAQSKKDMLKQQKLCKRVSDLETKLELARWELEQSLQEAPPVPELSISLARKPFKPGALASLPSERLLSAERNRSASDQKPAPTDMQSSTDHEKVDSTIPLEAAIHDLTSPSMQLRSELTSFNENGMHLNLTKGDMIAGEDTAKPKGLHGTPEMIAAANASVHRRRASGSRSSRGPIKHSASHASNIGRDLPKLPVKTPNNSPANVKENEPPVPPESELAESSKLRTLSQPLGRPAVPSPLRARKRENTLKRGTSPPPPSLASAKKPRVTFICPDDGISDTESNTSAQKALSAVTADEVLANKPLPEVQKEDFEWDEDVF